MKNEPHEKDIETMNPDDMLLPEQEVEDLALSDILNNEHFEENFNEIFIRNS